MPRKLAITHDEIRRLRTGGVCDGIIAKRAGCSTRTVRRVAAQIAAAPVRRFEVSRDWLIDLWNSDKTLLEIAREIGCSTQTVMRLGKEHGLPLRSQMQRHDPLRPSDEDEDASSDSLRLSPWVQARIEELKIGMPA